MKTLTQIDLEQFQKAIYKDYGIKLKGNELAIAANNLLGFISLLIDYSKSDKGSKTVQDNGLTNAEVKYNNELDRKK